MSLTLGLKRDRDLRVAVLDIGREAVVVDLDDVCVGAAQNFSKSRKRARLIDERDIDRHLAVRFYEALFDDDV